MANLKKTITKTTEIYLLFYFIFISGSYYQISQGHILKASYIILAVLAAMWAAYSLIENKSIIIPEYKNIYLLFLLSGITSIVHSINIPGSLLAGYLWVINLFIFLGIISLVNYGWDKQSLINSALIVAGIYNLIKILDIIKYWPGIIDLCERSNGLPSPNKTAVMINLIIIFSLGVILQGQKRTEKKIFPAILIITGIFILLASGSRGGIAAAPAGIITFYFIYNLRMNNGIKGPAFILAAAGSCLLVAGMAILLRPINCPSNLSWTNSITTRSELMRFAFILFLKRPLFGTGLNTYPVLSPLIFNTPAAIHPHNIYLKILAERGLFGFITAGLLVETISIDALINGEDPGLTAAAIGCVAAILAHGLVDYPFSEPYIFRYLVVIVALALSRPPYKES